MEKKEGTLVQTLFSLLERQEEEKVPSHDMIALLSLYNLLNILNIYGGRADSGLVPSKQSQSMKQELLNALLSGDDSKLPLDAMAKMMGKNPQKMMAMMNLLNALKESSGNKPEPDDDGENKNSRGEKPQR